MTSAIEQTKRVMYLKFGIVKDLAEDAGAAPSISVREFEISLEAHLEALRAELEYERKRSNDAIESRDAMQLRLHAVDHAYSEKQIKSGTSHQDYAENVASEAVGAKTAVILGAVVDVQRIVTDWSVKSIKAKEAMRLVANAVHGPSINSALHAFEAPERFVEFVCDFQFDGGIVKRSRSYLKVGGDEAKHECQHTTNSYGRCIKCLELFDIAVRAHL